MTTKMIIATSAVILLGVSSIGLSGCTQKPATTSSPKLASATSSSPAKTSTQTTTPSATPTTTPATPITANCGTLLSDGVIAKTYPGFVIDNNFKPSGESSGGKAIAEKGVACQWTDPNSGSKLTISAAHLGPETLAKLASALPGSATSEYSTTPNSTGSFQIINGIGMAQLVTDKFWITADSGEFYSSADAVAIMSMLLAALEWDASNS